MTGGYITSFSPMQNLIMLSDREPKDFNIKSLMTKMNYYKNSIMNYILHKGLVEK